MLVPFYFSNQTIFAFILLIVVIYIFSKYILPRFVESFSTFHIYSLNYSLPITILFFLIKKIKNNFYVFLWAFVIASGLKFPLRFMLNELDLLYCYPLFNIIFALLSVVAIANLKGNKVTKLMIVMGGALGLVTPYLVPYVYSYFYFICEGIACLTILLLDTYMAKVYIGGNTENTVSKIRDYLTSKRIHLTMYSTAPSAGSGINLGGSGSAGSGSGGIGASSSGSANTTAQSVSQTPIPSAEKGSSTPAEIDRMVSEIPKWVEHLLLNPNNMLYQMNKMSTLGFLPAKYIPDSIKRDIAQEAQRRSPNIISIPNFVSDRAMDYWHFKNVNSKATLELEMAKLIRERVNLPEAEQTRLNKSLDDYSKIMGAYQNASFYKMKFMFNDLNHQDRKSIKKHMIGYVTQDTPSDREDN